MSRTRCNPNPCLLLLLALYSWTTVECACPVPSSKPQQLVLVNGQVRVSSSYKDGASLQLSCPLGHSLNVTKGDSNCGSGSHINSVCSSNGRWEPYWPKCMVTKCGYLTVTNGNWRPKRLKAGSVTTVTCDAGYVLSQSGSISAKLLCNIDGQWNQTTPSCVKVPPASGCRSPAVIEGLQLRDSYVLQSVFALGSTVSYRCSLGYMRMGGQTAAQCTERGWTRPTLRCERKSCGSAGEIRNGQYVYDEGVLFGSRARAVCNQGHYLIGEGTRVCLNEGWDGREAVCEAVQCPPPPQVLGAEQLGSLEEPYLYQQVIGYRCRAGQLVGAREMHCTQNGTWSDNPPRCTELACRQPVVRFALWSWNKLHYRPGEWVGVSCQQGRRLQGPARLTCGADGQWEPAVPTCVPTWGSK